jgi:asparagine synthase (glutamine-hydrolysing)
MCGIAGFLNLTRPNFTVDASLLEKMQQSLAHRGPDGYRIWTNQEHNIGLMHRRLSIVDLSAAGFQPMFDEDKTIAVICNGEIYNHAQLRRDLENYGFTYQSNSDTESIVYAYKRWGIASLGILRGMFALAIYDLRKRELYLVRDRIGIKPLYFSVQGGVLSFASEIKALWQLPWIQQEIYPLGLYHYLTYMVTPAPMTLYKGIYKLPAAYYLKIDAGGNINFCEWYTPIKPMSEEQQRYQNHEPYHVHVLERMFQESVSSHTMSDVPYGAFLSGGLDSSLNVAMMARVTDSPVKTFNVSFSDGPEYNEITWARKVSHLFNTDHHEIIISEKEAFEFFQKMVYHQDEPLADCVCVPLYYVAKLLKDSGVTVVQVGEGSDELFCGYGQYAKYLDFYRRYWQRSQKYIPAFAKQSAYWLASRILADNHNKLSLIKNWVEGKNIFWSGATAFTELQKAEIVRKFRAEFDPIVDQICPGFDQSFNSYTIVDYHLQRLFLLDPKADFLKSMIYLELKHRLPELLLTRVDKMTMATSVEARVPYLDHPFVEHALNIPTSLKYRDGQTKYILKKTAENLLPLDIIYRPKVGFAAPTSRWFKSGSYFKPFFLDMIKTKRDSWGEYLNLPALESLYQTNQQVGWEYAVQLWTAQNVMGVPLG